MPEAKLIRSNTQQNSSGILLGINDTINSRTEIGFTFSENGKKYKLVYDIDKNLKEFYIDDKKIPKKDWKKHKKEIDTAFVRIEEHEKEMKKHEFEMQQHEKDMEQHEIDMKQQEKDMVQHEKEMRIIKEVFTELKKDNLIKGEIKSYEFSFKKSFLKINGKEQTKEVFEKY